MYDRYSPGALTNMDGASSLYVLKISKVLGGKESSVYILMITMHPFAKSQFNIKKKLQFNLTRARACDDNIKPYLNLFDITRLMLSTGVNLNDIPLDEKIPCYLFRGNDYLIKREKNQTPPSPLESFFPL